MEIAKRHQERLPQIKKYVEASYQFFQDNYKRFNDFKRFIFLTTISEQERTTLKTLLKPDIEFNVLEAYISRLRGEFAKQEPSIEVMADYETDIDPRTIKVVEGHLRHILTEANNDGCEYNVYTDLLAGGFSVFKVWTEYANPMSFNQVIKFDKVRDPTLCGFDPLAIKRHKGDGRYCFEWAPFTKEEIEDLYPNVDIKKVSFVRGSEGFNWSYKNQEEDIVAVVDFYEKKKKTVKIVKLTNGKTIPEEEYKKFMEDWAAAGMIEQPPLIVGEPRTTELEKIVRYRIVENQVIEYKETDYKFLPLVFVDGNSAWLREGTDGATYQITRPYVYHARGAQKLKNFAGQTAANELENMVQHKFKVAKESIPYGMEEAYKNPQLPNVLLFNSFLNNDPNVPLQPPMEIVRPPSPPIIENTFVSTDSIIQNILGSYDASLGINNNQLSGVAITEAATQSNATAMPYVVGFLLGLNQVAQIILNLLPKYYVTPRTIPIRGIDGKKTYVKINQQGQPTFDYDENALNVKVEAGVNFAIQKNRALQQILGLMQASPIFAQFINQEGLEVLLDNLEIRGIDQLKLMASGFMQQLKQQQQMAMQAQQQAIQNSPQMMSAQNERMKIGINKQIAEMEAQVDAAQIAVSKEKADTERMKVLVDLENNREQRIIQQEKDQTARIGDAVELAIKAADMSHKHAKETHELHHMLTTKKAEKTEKKE